MKTSLTVLAYAIVSWILLYAMLLVPQFTNHYWVNLVWMTLIAPNAMRYAVGMVPQLAVNRQFFFTSTMVSFILMYIINLANSKTREAMKDSRASNDKKLVLSALLSATFTVGALIAWSMNGGRSIYSNMGWD